MASAAPHKEDIHAHQEAISLRRVRFRRGSLPWAESRTGTTVTCPALPTWTVAPGALPGNGTGPSGSGPLANVSLSVQTHTNYGHPGIPGQSGKAKTVILNFDDDGVVNLAGIPTCTPGANGDPALTGGTTIATMWNGCGPGAADNSESVHAARHERARLDEAESPSRPPAEGHRPRQPPTSVAAR